MRTSAQSVIYVGTEPVTTWWEVLSVAVTMALYQADRWSVKVGMSLIWKGIRLEYTYGISNAYQKSKICICNQGITPN